MDFEFESPNLQVSLLVVGTETNLLANMAQVGKNPPVYDGRTIDDVQLFDRIEKLDKLDAYAVAQSELSKHASVYANSDTHKAFTNHLKMQHK